MLHYDFEESIGYWLCITAGAMQQAINDELSKHGITYRQFQVLGWLVHDGEQLSQAELAAKMAIEPPTLVGLLDRMEQQGWITRVGCPDDRRKKLVCLAPAAEAVWETMVETLLHVRAKATSRLSPEQVESLKEILRIVHGTLAEAVPEPVTAE
jgi:MarR family transcriptional regulator for hemolysin